MKLIRNRKLIRMKRRATIHGGAQEMAKKDAMIEWLAKSCEELTDLIWYPEIQCPKLKSDWIKAAEKAVEDANR